jgi:hypothetical protein
VIIAAVCWQSSFTPAIGQPCLKPCRPVAGMYLRFLLPAPDAAINAPISLWPSHPCHQPRTFSAINSQYRLGQASGVPASASMALVLEQPPLSQETVCRTCLRPNNQPANSPTRYDITT